MPGLLSRWPGVPFTVRALAALAAGGAVAACGPSFQAVYEGNARFERCYALEEDPHVPMPDKASCWRDWSERYTYGQTKDRVHYATARYVALSQAPHLPTDEALMMAAPGEAPRATTITAPAPTNAFAPPPKVLDVSEHETAKSPEQLREVADIPVLAIDAGAPGLPPAPTGLPARTCTEACEGAYRTCSDGCAAADVGPPASKAKGCQACQRAYRACMRDCFK